MSKRSLTAVLFALLFLAGCQRKEQPRCDVPVTEPNFELIIPVGMFDTELSGYWAYTPDIKICPGAGITKPRVKQALSFWSNVGYRFGNITVVENEGRPCSAMIGEIAFRIPTQEEISTAVQDHQLGVAKTQIDRFTMQILSADIYFQRITASHSQRLVEHEVGHALGWKHHNRASHIMNSSLSQAGESKIGMEQRFYDERIGEILTALESAGNE